MSMCKWGFWNDDVREELPHSGIHAWHWLTRTLFWRASVPWPKLAQWEPVDFSLREGRKFVIGLGQVCIYRAALAPLRTCSKSPSYDPHVCHHSFPRLSERSIIVPSRCFLQH